MKITTYVHPVLVLSCFLSTVIFAIGKGHNTSASAAADKGRWRSVLHHSKSPKMSQSSELLSMVLLGSILLPMTGGDRVISSADIETLQLAQVIFRHGARSPLASYAKDPYNNTQFWPDGLGQLTAKGKLMEFELGEYLRWRYTGFVNRSYIASEIYAQSSDIDRTIMSADLVLAGLFPPTEESPSSMWNPAINWQPLPVHTIPYTEDNKLSFAAKCPRYDTLFDDYLASPEMKLVDEKNADMYKYLSTKSGVNITNITGINDIYDVLYIQAYHQLKLPTWASRYYPGKLRPLAEIVWEAIVATEEMKRLRMGPLLGNLMTNMDKARKQHEQETSSEAKLYLYSGHDSTVAALLGSLSVFDRQTPPYSSAVIVELHQENKHEAEPGKHFVKVFFRNDTSRHPYELKIPKCGNPCTLDELKGLLNHLIITDWNTWNNECQKNSIFSLTRAKTFLQGIEFWASVTFVLIFFIGFVLASIFCIVVILPWHRKKMFLVKNDDENCGKYSPSSSNTTSRNSISNNNYKV